jgi:hypothetical protein
MPSVDRKTPMANLSLAQTRQVSFRNLIEQKTPGRAGGLFICAAAASVSHRALDAVSWNSSRLVDENRE